MPDGGRSPYLIVLSEVDPVARGVAERWGALPSTSDHLGGATIRRLSGSAEVVHRPALHIHDDDLAALLPPSSRWSAVVFPSVHRSESGTPCVTVHPIGNLGPRAEVGGRPRELVPTSPGLMTGALRALSERSKETALPATFEATHHGPRLGVPAFFVEVATPEAGEPPKAGVGAIAEILGDLRSDGSETVAVGVGGGHYAPRFTDLAIRRRWAFGHLVPRYALPDLDGATIDQLWSGTPHARGYLFARTEDAHTGIGETMRPMVRENDAPTRSAPGD